MSLYSLLAFLIPLPLFFDLRSLSFIIHPVEHDKVLMLEGAAPIPIALMALTLIILFSFSRVMRLRINKTVLITLVCVGIFYFIASSRVETLKLLAVLLPIFFLLAFSRTVSQPPIVKKIVKGYLAGLLFETYLHVASTFFYSPIWENPITASRTIFGYEVYQALISYSAVLSLATGAAVIYALSQRNLLSMLRILMLALPCFLITILASRKAALVDLMLIFLISTFFMLRSVRFMKIYVIRKETLMHAFILTNLLFLGYMFMVFSPREINLGYSLEQRSDSYEYFMANLPTLSWFQILVGYESGWGGYSNFIVEVFVRSGLIGMTTYFFGLALATRYFYRALITLMGDYVRILRGNIYIKSWFAFVLGNFVVGNLVNMNIQLPFYTMNLLMINVCFVFFYSRYLREQSRFSHAVF